MTQNLPLRTPGGRNGILMIGLVAIIVVLCIAGLLLPPISLPSRLGLATGGCKTLSAKNPTLDHADGLSVALDADAKGTLALKLTSSKAADLPDNSPLKAALKQLPKGYSAKGPIFQIATCGSSAAPATVSVLIPEGVSQPEALDMWNWNGKSWEWLGGHLDTANGIITLRVSKMPQSVVVAQSSAASSVVAADMPASGNAVPDGLSLATVIFVPGLQPADDGGLNGDPAALPKPPDGTPAAQYPSIRNWAKPGRSNAGLVSDMLADAKLRSTHVKALTDLVAKSRYAGLQIDYRGLTEDDRAAFTDLIVRLADALHKVNKRLVVVLPVPLLGAEAALGTTWSTAGYDWRAISAVADMVQADLPVDPAMLGTSTAEELVRWIIGETNRGKLLLGLTSLSVEQAGRDLTYLSFDQALKPLGEVKGPQGPVPAGSAVAVTLAGNAQNVIFDAATQAYRYSYTVSGQALTVTLGSAGSLATKLNWATKNHVRGVAIRGLLDAGNDPAVFAAMQQFTSQTAPEETPVQIMWVAQGKPVETTPLTKTQITWTAPANPGNYTVGASISGLTRGQASVVVGGAAPAPTPIVTSTTVTTPTGSADCQLKVAFVSDVTIPDNSKMEKGAAFTKTWRVKNSGTCDWPADTVLAFVSGNKLGAPDTAPVGAVKVGETKDISVNMKAPNEDANKVAGLWRLKSGTQTAGSLSVVIVSGNPQVATPTPPPPAVGPVAPPSSGPTQYGIHAHWAAMYNDEPEMGKVAGQINDLGLGWTKLQVRWGEEDFFYDCSGNFGFDWNHTNQVINEAGAKGLRVLFSVVTAPPCTHPATADVNVPPDDVNAFAAFVGELASRYAGRGIAIEIWERENATPNLDAARYSQMLAASYNKIKAADSGIIVIAGAPAPFVTGGDVEASTYLQQMKNAGANKYMDCVGAHFNDSNSPPDTSLFKGIVQGYQGIMGKQACITSFGVGSEQNVGSIAGVDYFKNITEQNQSDWVTQGMQLARDWGTRMIILFNLDYGPRSGKNTNALFSFFTPGFFKRPVYGAVKNWCASNGCK